MNSRLLQFLNAENITQAQFADSIGVTRASISHIISGRNKPSYEFISVMMKKYPQLNPEWLILGKGRMYNDRPAQQTSDVSGGEDLLFPTDFESVGPTLQEPPRQMTPVPSRMNAGSLPDSQAAAAQNEEYQSPGPSPAPAVGVTAGSPMVSSAVTSSRPRSVSKIIVFFDDGTFQEMRG